ncbi:MAG: hypothetical protein AAF483_29815 [Planctomycetota bacterium]
MRKFLGTFVILLLLFCVVGFFRGWLSLSTGSDDQKTSLELTVDREGLKTDANQLKEKVKQMASGESEQTEAEEANAEWTGD